ncbi:hypothetical protein [Marinobacterium rhizophilum]|uniref:Transposase n=1 Tax=Marinobacterium rhizophilum TaxID=420402 RepID=A0ABY5HG33_9GAMM|nr:hypothetical protein [Marinobacterium rhizophilum]UTW11326.1 hypothetical protein KDW95_18985 [Marinobacterium rhizophilum]
MMKTAYEQLRKLMQHLGLVRTPSLGKARSPERNPDNAAMSPVQRSSARAARKNPWLLAG